MGAKSRLHKSGRNGRWLRCVAKKSCPYGEHKTIVQLAKGGGAEISTNGHSQVQTVSPVIGGVFTVGTGKRKQTFKIDGSKMTPKEARVWRAKLKRFLRAARKASTRAAKRQLRRTVSRAKLRAKWAVQDSSKAFLLGVARAMEATAEGIYNEIDALAHEFADEWEAQLAAFEELLNPPGADC